MITKTGDDRGPVACDCSPHLRCGSLFAGIGGFDLGFARVGIETVWQVELNEFCRSILARHWPNVRRHDDVRTWPQPDAGHVDVICGGFPCQDISNSGHRAGIQGERSGLWTEFARIVREFGPRYVVVENVAALAVRGLDVVLRDLALLGFDAEWGVLPTCAMGAPHTRERLFVVANAKGSRRFSPPHPNGRGGEAIDGKNWSVTTEQARGCLGVGRRDWWTREPSVARVVDGVSADVDGPNRAIGNSVSPIVAEWIGRGIVEAATA